MKSNVTLTGTSCIALLALVVTCSGLASDGNCIIDPELIRCPGNVTHTNVLLSAYRPIFDSERKRDYLDLRHRKLYTLQDYLDDRAPYVTVGMDDALRLPYGTEVCIPELNRQFRRLIKLQVRDTHEDLDGGRYERVDICVRTHADTFDDFVNMMRATLVL